MFRVGVASVMGVLCVVPCVHAAVAYGPSYDPSTQTGYVGDELAGLAPTVRDGYAVGTSDKISNGANRFQRPLLWDANGNVTELGNLGTDTDGGTDTEAHAVNATGTVVGLSEKYAPDGTYFGPRAVRWDAGSATATELDNLGTRSNGVALDEADAVNTAGTAVGQAEKYSNGTFLGMRAVRWAAGGTAITELGNLGGDDNGVTNTQVYAINTAGTSVGYADEWQLHLTSPYYSAVRWDAGTTTPTKLDGFTDINGFTYSKAYAINDSGTIVGTSEKYDPTGRTALGDRPVRWAAGGTSFVELDNIGTDDTGSAECGVNAINADGTSVGWAAKYNGHTPLGERATRWDAGGTAVTELGILGTDSNGQTTTEAHDINASGITVGDGYEYADDGTFIRQAAIAWGPDGVAFDLNSLLGPNSGWKLELAEHISDTNWISGRGMFDPDGDGPLDPYYRDFLIQLPEPTAGFALAFLAFAFPRRRRTRRVGAVATSGNSARAS